MRITIISGFGGYAIRRPSHRLRLLFLDRNYQKLTENFLMGLSWGLVSADMLSAAPFFAAQSYALQQLRTLGGLHIRRN